MNCNYKVKMVDLQNKYKFKIFCSSQMYDDSELKREVEAIYKAFPKASSTGTNASLDGTAAAIMNIDLKGNGASVTGDNTINICGKNLFDKNNANVLDGMFINAAAGNIGSNANATSIYIPINPNTTYCVSKTKGNRFAMGYLSTTPALNVSLTDIVDDRTKTSLTSTSGSDSKYLVIYISLSDTETYENIISTIQIEKSSTPTDFKPYIGKSYPINLGSTKLKTDDSIQGSKNNWNIVRADGTIEPIADTTLISQLNNLRYNAESYEGTTNISQVNSDMPFIFTASAIKDLSNL